MDEQPLRLLVIEDNQDDALLLLRALHREGFAVEHRRVETAGGMTEALDQEPWDAVISDYALPSFSAPEALRLFRARADLDIPFIVVSGAVGEETAAALMKDGAHDYVSKQNLSRIGPAIRRELKEAEERRQHRRAEVERVQLQEQLHQAQKMEAIGVLTAGVAHDFNNLLGAIQIYADLAQMKAEKGSAFGNELQQILNITDRAATLARQLLLFSRKQQMALVPFDLNAVASDLLKMLQRIIGEHIAVETDLDPALPAVRGDDGGIEQVIMNLAVNARDAMPGGGAFRISTRAVEIGEGEAQRHPGAHAGHFAALAIRDSGTGMDEETRKRIFEPFFTTKGVGKGTGLGLSVVYGIVTQHGGWIDLETAPGAGTCFTVYLPLAGSAATAPSVDADPLARYRGSGERLLLVEDEEGFRGVMAEALRANGYEVDEAPGVRAAREKLAPDTPACDLALIDVGLPDGDGLELALEIGARPTHPHLLLTSGHTDERSRMSDIRAHGLPFIAKPFSFPALLMILRKILGSPDSTAPH